MAKPRVLVLRSPGTNCDEETLHAFELAGAAGERIHINRILEAPQALSEFQILCVPGGFSYGDDVSAGRILANQLRLGLGDALFEFRDRGGLMLGVCNGFQVLLKAGLLIEPDPKTKQAQATLGFNTHGRYEDRWVHLQLKAGRCAFIRDDAQITLPIAHAEGNFVVSDESLLDRLEADHRLAARYVDADGTPGPFPINPNGSMRDVAGVCDETGRVFGLMPHPERHLYFWNHPRWTRRDSQPDQGDGRIIFQNAVSFFE